MPAPIVPAPMTLITPATGASPPECGSASASLAPSRALGLARHAGVDPGHRPSDDQFLDLGGSLVEGGHAYGAEVAHDGVVVDAAGAVVHMDRRVGALHRRLGGVQLCDRGLDGV